MYSHIARMQTHSLFGGTRYLLRAQIHLTPEETRIIARHRLHRMEIFHDPIRDELDASAAAAHGKAKTRGLFPTKARDAASICAAEMAALIASMRACYAFTITLGDLCRGVSISHKSLQAIDETERVLTECIDSVDRFVRAAARYANETEDVFAPGADDDGTVPPAQWPRTWRH